MKQICHIQHNMWICSFCYRFNETLETAAFDDIHYMTTDEMKASHLVIEIKK